MLESLATDITAYTLHILNLGCTPGVDAAELDARLDPASRPLALRMLPRAALPAADPKDCGELLRGLIQKKCDEYRAEADRLWTERDEPELERMLEEAGFLSDADAKRWQRCHAEQRLSFHRSEQALYKSLERDREADDDGSPSEPRIAPEAPSQMMIQREDPAEEQSAGQGVPIRGPWGAGHDHAEPFPPEGGSARDQGSSRMSGLASHGPPGTGSAG